MASAPQKPPPPSSTPPPALPLSTTSSSSPTPAAPTADPTAAAVPPAPPATPVRQPSATAPGGPIVPGRPRIPSRRSSPLNPNSTTANANNAAAAAAVTPLAVSAAMAAAAAGSPSPSAPSPLMMAAAAAAASPTTLVASPVPQPQQPDPDADLPAAGTLDAASPPTAVELPPAHQHYHSLRAMRASSVSASASDLTHHAAAVSLASSAQQHPASTSSSGSVETPAIAASFAMPATPSRTRAHSRSASLEQSVLLAQLAQLQLQGGQPGAVNAIVTGAVPAPSANASAVQQQQPVTPQQQQQTVTGTGHITPTSSPRLSASLHRSAGAPSSGVSLPAPVTPVQPRMHRANSSGSSGSGPTAAAAATTTAGSSAGGSSVSLSHIASTAASGSPLLPPTSSSSLPRQHHHHYDNDTADLPPSRTASPRTHATQSMSMTGLTPLLLGSAALGPPGSPASVTPGTSPIVGTVQAKLFIKTRRHSTASPGPRTPNSPSSSATNSPTLSHAPIGFGTTPPTGSMAGLVNTPVSPSAARTLGFSAASVASVYSGGSGAGGGGGSVPSSPSSTHSAASLHRRSRLGSYEAKGGRANAVSRDEPVLSRSAVDLVARHQADSASLLGRSMSPAPSLPPAGYGSSPGGHAVGEGGLTVRSLSSVVPSPVPEDDRSGSGTATAADYSPRAPLTVTSALSARSPAYDLDDDEDDDDRSEGSVASAPCLRSAANNVLTPTSAAAAASTVAGFHPVFPAAQPRGPLASTSSLLSMGILRAAGTGSTGIPQAGPDAAIWSVLAAPTLAGAGASSRASRAELNAAPSHATATGAAGAASQSPARRDVVYDPVATLSTSAPELPLPPVNAAEASHALQHRGRHRYRPRAHTTQVQRFAAAEHHPSSRAATADPGSPRIISRSPSPTAASLSLPRRPRSPTPVPSRSRSEGTPSPSPSLSRNRGSRSSGLWLDDRGGAASDVVKSPTPPPAPAPSHLDPLEPASVMSLLGMKPPTPPPQPPPPLVIHPSIPVGIAAGGAPVAAFPPAHAPALAAAAAAAAAVAADPVGSMASLAGSASALTTAHGRSRSRARALSLQTPDAAALVRLAADFPSLFAAASAFPAVQAADKLLMDEATRYLVQSRHAKAAKWHRTPDRWTDWVDEERERRAKTSACATWAASVTPQSPTTPTTPGFGAGVRARSASRGAASGVSSPPPPTAAYPRTRPRAASFAGPSHPMPPPLAAAHQPAADPPGAAGGAANRRRSSISVSPSRRRSQSKDTSPLRRLSADNLRHKRLSLASSSVTQFSTAAGTIQGSVADDLDSSGSGSGSEPPHSRRASETPFLDSAHAHSRSRSGLLDSSSLAIAGSAVPSELDLAASVAPAAAMTPTMIHSAAGSGTGSPAHSAEVRDRSHDLEGTRIVEEEGRGRVLGRRASGESQPSTAEGSGETYPEEDEQEQQAPPSRPASSTPQPQPVLLQGLSDKFALLKQSVDQTIARSMSQLSAIVEDELKDGSPQGGSGEVAPTPLLQLLLNLIGVSQAMMDASPRDLYDHPATCFAMVRRMQALITAAGLPAGSLVGHCVYGILIAAAMLSKLLEIKVAGTTQLGAAGAADGTSTRGGGHGGAGGHGDGAAVANASAKSTAGISESVTAAGTGYSDYLLMTSDLNSASSSGSGSLSTSTSASASTGSSGSYESTTSASSSFSSASGGSSPPSEPSASAAASANASGADDDEPGATDAAARVGSGTGSNASSATRRRRRREKRANKQPRPQQLASMAAADLAGGDTDDGLADDEAEHYLDHAKTARGRTRSRSIEGLDAARASIPALDVAGAVHLEPVFDVPATPTAAPTDHKANYVFELTLDARFRYVAPMFAQMLGQDPDHLQHMSLGEVFSPVEEALFRDAIALLVESASVDDHASANVQFTVLQGGREVLLDSKGVLVPQRGDALPYTVWVATRDVTTVLCHVCERRVPDFMFELHTPMCVDVHKAEMEVGLVVENLRELHGALERFLPLPPSPMSPAAAESPVVMTYTPAASADEAFARMLMDIVVDVTRINPEVNDFNCNLPICVMYLPAVYTASATGAAAGGADAPSGSVLDPASGTATTTPTASAFDQPLPIPHDCCPLWVPTSVEGWTIPPDAHPDLVSLSHDLAAVITLLLEANQRLLAARQRQWKILREEQGHEGILPTPAMFGASPGNGASGNRKSRSRTMSKANRRTRTAGGSEMDVAAVADAWRSGSQTIGELDEDADQGGEKRVRGDPPTGGEAVAPDAADDEGDERSRQGSQSTARTRQSTAQYVGVGDLASTGGDDSGFAGSAANVKKHRRRRRPSAINTLLGSSGRSSSSKLSAAPLIGSPLASPKSMRSTTAPSIRDYELVKPISRGAFGSVYLARKIITGEYCAIKVLRKADMIAKNQVTNVKAERLILMMQPDSPFVTRLYCSFQTRESLYLVMEYMNGGDCAALLKAVGCLPEDWARTYLAEMVLILEYLHGIGIIHRDLKPDNFLIHQSGHLKLTDFGLSRIGFLGRREQAATIASPAGTTSTPSESAAAPAASSSSLSVPPATTALGRRRSMTEPYGGGGLSSGGSLPTTPLLANYVLHSRRNSTCLPLSGDPLAHAPPSFLSAGRSNSGGGGMHSDGNLSSPESAHAPGQHVSASAASLTSSGLQLTPRSIASPRVEREPIDPNSLNAPIPPPPPPPSSSSMTMPGLSRLTESPKEEVGSEAAKSSESSPASLQQPIGPAAAVDDLTAAASAASKPHRFVGTPDYLAPESILGIGQDDATVDWWALGVILYEFLFGIPPFHADSVEEVFENILSRRLELSADMDEDVSPEAIDLIDKLLTMDPEQRLGAGGAPEVKAHPFFKEVDWDTLLAKTPNFIPKPTSLEDTDYFDDRGVEAIAGGNTPRSSTASGSTDQAHSSHASGGGGSRSSGRRERGRERESSSSHRLSDLDGATSFGNFSFRNLDVLEKANIDTVQRLKSEQQQSISSSMSGLTSASSSFSSLPLSPASPLISNAVGPAAMQQQGRPRSRSSSSTQPRRPRVISFSAGVPTGSILSPYESAGGSTGQVHSPRSETFDSDASSSAADSPVVGSVDTAGRAWSNSPRFAAAAAAAAAGTSPGSAAAVPAPFPGSSPPRPPGYALPSSSSATPLQRSLFSGRQRTMSLSSMASSSSTTGGGTGSGSGSSLGSRPHGFGPLPIPPPPTASELAAGAASSCSSTPSTPGNEFDGMPLPMGSRAADAMSDTGGGGGSGNQSPRSPPATTLKFAAAAGASPPQYSPLAPVFPLANDTTGGSSGGASGLPPWTSSTPPVGGGGDSMSGAGAGSVPGSPVLGSPLARCGSGFEAEGGSRDSPLSIASAPVHSDAPPSLGLSQPVQLAASQHHHRHHHGSASASQQQLSSRPSSSSQQTARRAATGSAVSSRRDGPVRVLVADDNPIACKILETILRRLGAMCCVVFNGAEAVRLATGSVQFDMIFMDAGMPILDGENAARMIRSTDNVNRLTPIIAVTGYERTAIAGKYFNVVLPKMVNKAQVVQLFRDHGLLPPE
ncbi:rim15, signal transduction response regulator [Blastocladiella emersonii ATCC 22665]|nr:rim15, signal transduction response regulator [Blastocladiella emersonii ATCC 22665]